MATNYFIRFENDTDAPPASYNTIVDAEFTEVVDKEEK